MLIDMEPHDKRLRIIQAAVQVIAQKGFHRAKMEEIARKADVGKGTLYEYFPSKEQLFIEMVKLGNKFYHSQLMEHIKYVEGCAEKLRAVAYLHMIFFSEHRDMAQVMMQEYMQFGPLVREEFARFYEQEIRVIQEIISKGIEEGSLRSLEARKTAWLFYGAVHTISCKFIYEEDKSDLEKLAEEVTEIFLKGIVHEN
ncbi:MAG: TetR/AcrR family transcriptional regulator [Dehalobacterium sp.]